MVGVTMSELQRYRKMLKDNDTHIKYLQDANKHIKDHIKFLEKFEPVEAVASTVDASPIAIEEIQ
jgi:hypothetical protein